MFALIVAALTLVVAAFVIVWLLSPRFRSWIEAPKYRIVDQERRFKEKGDGGRDPPVR